MNEYSLLSSHKTSE